MTATPRSSNRPDDSGEVAGRHEGEEMSHETLRKFPARSAKHMPPPAAVTELAADIVDIARRRGQKPADFCNELIRQAERRAA